jgi:hypothetical protein
LIMLVNWIEFTLITHETPERRHERLVHPEGPHRRPSRPAAWLSP